VIISKCADAPYSPGNRGLWVELMCENREGFVVVDWTDPEGSRPWLGGLLLAYYDPNGRLGIRRARRPDSGGWLSPADGGATLCRVWDRARLPPGTPRQGW
jgi:ATP-dependent DNA ligase